MNNSNNEAFKRAISDLNKNWKPMTVTQLKQTEWSRDQINIYNATYSKNK